MNEKVGFRIFKDFERPSQQLVERFRGIPSSNIGDILSRLYCMRHEICPFNDNELLGVAFTVKAPAGDNLVLHKALDLAKPGDVIVVDAEGCVDRSLMGEMMFTYAERRGIKGVVVDGAIRDVDAAKRSSMAVYAKAVTPQGPYKFGPGEINVPVSCGGQVVFPGDILVGDGDGIVVIRPEIAGELAEEAIRKHNKEQEELERRAAETSTAEMEMRHDRKYDAVLKELGIQYHEYADRKRGINR
ncbi:RraA family protein [Enterocloster asparagiformis]|uniref:RraA family protein n=1 Tax=Enterocloster asparagiformis TaxID=333367 RepID=UPI002A810D34|nr:RraA family protein [Enterocloster asparagiformis]